MPKPSLLWPVAALLAYNLAFYWRVLFTDSAMFPYDAADYFYPALGFVHEQLRHFRLPLWDPYVLSGYPIIGDIQAQIFYPVNWLFVLLNPSSPLPYRLVEMQEIAHFTLAGIFLYLLAREFVESDLAALAGGLLYMAGGAMVARAQHVNAVDAMAWTPLIILLACRGLLRRSCSYTLAAGILFGVQLLAGRWQHSVYLGLLLFLYFAYEGLFGETRAKLWPGWILRLAVIAGAGAALAMVQIIPAYQLGGESIRSFVNYWEVSAGNHPRFLWTLFVPNYLGGINGFPMRYPYDLTYNYVFLTVPGMLLALWGIVETTRRRNYFWLSVMVLFTVLALGNQGPLSELVYRAPVLNLFRVSAAFFEIAHLALCLLAAIGAQHLLASEIASKWKRAVLVLLGLLLTAAAAATLLGVAAIPSWRHALAALAVFSVIVLARLWNKLAPNPALAAVLAVIAFELWFYNSGQSFNSAPENPSTFLSADYAAGRTEAVSFLRSDTSGGFRAVGLAEYQWSGNGWNLWRIPGITGVNPVALRRYYQYMRGFSHVMSVRTAKGGEDHSAGSPLAELLGVKYVVLANPEREAALGLGLGSKFTPVFEDIGWWRVYRNEQHFQHGWFYPNAYLLPDEQHIFDLLSSPWFDPRRVLLLEKGAMPPQANQPAEELTTVAIFPGEGVEFAGGAQIRDPYCSEPLPMLGGWGASGSEIRFDVPSDASPGHYRLLIRYTANELEMTSLGLDMLSRESPWYNTALPVMPQLQATLQGSGEAVQAAPVSLPRTFGWPCHEARSADLGEFEIAPGANRIVIAPPHETVLNIYSLWLARIPDSPPREPAPFAFRGFDVLENRIAFAAEVAEDGFLLLNEVYYPGWEAAVDGQPATIYPADGVFRALYLTAGVHSVEFIFRPRYFRLGAAISLLTIAGFLGYGAVALRRRKRMPPA